jgi:glutamate-1-semialdehyde 2,1-aminomutase
VLPGGNTRSVLFFEPFPLTMARGEGADVRDVDQHGYADFVGEFSAGLYGHSDPTIKAAIHDALDMGVVLAAPTRLEAELAAAINARFPSMERLRFCNSGTEANLLAIATALAATGRRKVLVFREAYHGGVLVFSGGGGPLNVPFDFVLADYNDVEGATRQIRAHARELAAVVVEPILGAGGNIPATKEFLAALRKETSACGALLIFDEVKTSRCGPGGIQGELGIQPDMTTLGKYIGGGLPSGVFGGRKELMDRFDPRRPDGLRHAGTFNNNVCSMMAGLAGLTRVFTAERARQFLGANERFRSDLNGALAATGLPMRLIGLGSMFTVHFSKTTIHSPADIPPASRRLSQLFHMESLQRGVLVASRGDIFISLAAANQHLTALREAVLWFADTYAPLIRRELNA